MSDYSPLQDLIFAYQGMLPAGGGAQTPSNMVAGTNKPMYPTTVNQPDQATILWNEILKRMNATAPVAPQVETSFGSRMKMIGARGNPSLENMLTQEMLQNTPGGKEYLEKKTQYDAQQSQIPQLASMYNTQQRNSNRPLKFVTKTINENGVPQSVVDIYDSTTGEYLGRNRQGETFVPPALTQYVDPNLGAAQVGFASRTGNHDISPVTEGGKPVGAIPPQGLVNEQGRTEANISGLESVRDAYREIRSKTEGQLPMMQWAREKGVNAIPFLSATFPDYANYIARRRASLNSYVKQQTGAQFSIKELDRYEGQYPEPWDPEDVADQKLASLRERALADMQARLKMYPNLGGKKNKKLDAADDILNEYNKSTSNAPQ